MANLTAADHRTVLKRVFNDKSTPLDLALAINFLLATLDAHISANVLLEERIGDLMVEFGSLRILDRHVD